MHASTTTGRETSAYCSLYVARAPTQRGAFRSEHAPAYLLRVLKLR